MSNLLAAGIYRYRKSIMFRMMIVVSLILGLITGMVTDSSTDVEIVYFVGLFLVIAIQISLMIGVEFSNGAIRNKMVAGHGKGMVFLSELLLSLISTTLLFVVFYGAFAVFNIQWFDNVEAHTIASVVIGLWLVHLSLSTICTAICFFMPYYTAVAAVLDIVLVLAMVFCCHDLRSRFDQPEYTYSFHSDENGNKTYDNDTPNPKYIPPDSAKYALLHAAYYIMPHGQLIDHSAAMATIWRNGFPNEKYLDDLKTAPLYSLMTIGTFTAAGLICFRKRNLK